MVRSPEALGKEAIDVLSLIYHHGVGEKMKDMIKRMSVDIPTWRNTNLATVPEDTRKMINHARSWDRAIKLLTEAGRL